MKLYRSVTTNTPLGTVGMQGEEILGAPYELLLDASYEAVHSAPSYGLTRINFEWKEEGVTRGWVRMTGQQIIDEVLREDTVFAKEMEERFK